MHTRAGSTGLGHVRYPTAGSSSVQEAQPFFVNSPLGIYLIHNGNLTNTDALRTLLNSSTSFFNRCMRTSSDSEVLLNVLADEIHRAHQRCLLEDACDPNRKKLDLVAEAVAATMKLIQGAYSCIALINGVGLLAFRDPHGIRCVEGIVDGGGKERGEGGGRGIERGLRGQRKSAGPLSHPCACRPAHAMSIRRVCAWEAWARSPPPDHPTTHAPTHPKGRWCWGGAWGGAARSGAWRPRTAPLAPSATSACATSRPGR